MDEHPVGLVVTDDLRRSRLTVFFRVFLAIPHVIWVVIWTAGVVVAAIAGWVAMLVTGRLPGAFHRFFCAYISYTAHLGAYLALVANPYPPFDGSSFAYPLELRLPDPATQSRWRVLLRLPLAIPALIVATALGGVPTSLAVAHRKNNASANSSAVGGLLFGVFFLGWFAGVFAARMPRGLRDAGAYAIGYRAQTLAYLLLVTDRYPNSDPVELLTGFESPPLHPVRIVGDAHDLRRSRVTVLFRFVLAIPHLVWLVLWTVLAVLVGIAQWFVTLVRGRPAAGMHRFLTRYVRYSFHVSAFLWLVANPFPGFVGEPGYPLDVELPPPGRQNQWKTGFRVFLAVPAVIVNSCLGTALGAAAVVTWFAALARGSAPWGLRNLSAYSIRYSAQLSAYAFLLTDVYPHASPLEGVAEDVAPAADVA